MISLNSSPVIGRRCSFVVYSVMLQMQFVKSMFEIAAIINSYDMRTGLSALRRRLKMKNNLGQITEIIAFMQFVCVIEFR